MDAAPGDSVFIWGLGRSGQAVAEHFRAAGRSLCVWDDALATVSSAEQASWLTQRLGWSPLVCPPHQAFSASTAVLSPGVDVGIDWLRCAWSAGCRVTTEAELALRACTGRIVAVTGTNGKSTVTKMIGAIVDAAGLPVFCGGNLGTPLISALAPGSCHAAAVREGVVVAELSSFQLEYMQDARADVAVWLSLAPDHLDRHRTMTGYVRAKAQIFEGSKAASGAAVVPAPAPPWATLAEAVGRDVYGFEAAQVGHLRYAALGVDEAAEALPFWAPHDLENAQASLAVAHALGIDARSALTGLRRFEPLPHRLAKVESHRGVDWFDDSKATNVHAAAAAVASVGKVYSKLVLLAGGRAKEHDFSALRRALVGRARVALVFGEAAPLLREALADGGFETETVADLDAAVRRAAELARPGDAVLLSPACASFDAFSSYVDRGQAFVRAVQKVVATA